MPELSMKSLKQLIPLDIAMESSKLHSEAQPVIEARPTRFRLRLLKKRQCKVSRMQADTCENLARLDTTIAASAFLGIRNIRGRVGPHHWPSILGAPPPGQKIENISIIHIFTE